jgi:hypothetical protein
MHTEDFIHSKIGIALVSGQRVEFVIGELLKHILKFDKNVYGITTEIFLNDSPPARRLRHQTLGQIFRLLKLDPRLIIAHELDEYSKKRNTLVHSLWKDYLFMPSEEQITRAIGFCCDFERSSARLESYFKGCLYFIAMSHVKDRDELAPEPDGWKNDLEYFVSRSIKEQISQK